MKHVSSFLLATIIFSSAAMAQNFIPATPENSEPVQSDEVEVKIEVPATLDPNYGEICTGLIANFDKAKYKSPRFKATVLAGTVALGVNGVEAGVNDHGKQMPTISTPIYAAAAVTFVHALIRANTLQTLKNVVDQAQACSLYQLCADEEYEKFAEKTVDGTVDMEKFSNVVLNNTHSFCSTSKGTDGTLKLKVKSGWAINNLIQERYAQTN